MRTNDILDPRKYHDRNIRNMFQHHIGKVLIQKKKVVLTLKQEHLTKQKGQVKSSVTAIKHYVPRNIVRYNNP